MMSGENELKTPTIDDKHVKIIALLKQYPVKVGLGLLQPINEVNRYLTMTVNEQRKLTAEECGEAAVILNQSATYIQLEINRIKADINWCNNYINWLVANKVMEYGSTYTPFEYRRLLASRDNDVAMQLHGIIADAELQEQSLAYLPNALRATASSFGDLQQTKRSQRI